MPDRIEATVAQGVVFVPAQQMEGEAWCALSAATLAPQTSSTNPLPEANVLRRKAEGEA